MAPGTDRDALLAAMVADHSQTVYRFGGASAGPGQLKPRTR